jgi:Rrf2 family protein
MAHIAAEKATKPLASHEVAQAYDIPERFLLKVLKPLVSAGLLTSVKGPHGGYRLARSPKDISMLDIVEAVEGPIRGAAAFSAPGHQSALEKRLTQICQNAAESLRKQLQSIRLTSLI